MKRRTGFLVLVLVAAFLLSTVSVFAFAGKATATGVVKKNGTFARIGKSKHRTGKVKILVITITDKFGRERTITNWKYVGGKGTSRPTVKFTGSDKPKKGEHVSIDIETQTPGPSGGFPLMDLHLY